MQGISPVGAASIADALLGRGQLLTLKLAHNPLTSTGEEQPLMYECTCALQN